jgi:KUP system potassium uptake protein
MSSNGGSSRRGKGEKKAKAPSESPESQGVAEAAQPDTSTSSETSQSGEGAALSEPAGRGAKRKEANDEHHGHQGSHMALLIGAIGVVYGDIGTSPLYALRECFHHSTGIHPEANDVLGLLSLFFWSLTLVVTFKYVVVLTRADNHGEGGILALLALVLPKRSGPGISALALLGMFGAALLYADGVLTPAVSVTSAVEGMTGIRALADVGIERWVVPISVFILFALFAAQRRGTASVGAFFGPVMLTWFAVLAGLGIYWIGQHPGVLWALSPSYAVSFFLANGLSGYWVLGSVVLCVTGGEALYADMGHFGRAPISGAWRFVVLPALLLNYFGQGALLLDHPDLSGDPFFAMVGEGWPRIPMVILATMATVVASQALISGAFSLTRQAIQLGFLPRLEIRHTSSETEGQIYIPEINWGLAIACMLLVAALQSSSNMAAAYGIAVTGTMLITTMLFFVLARRWWGGLRAGALCLLFIVVDLAFLIANVRKIQSGGWIPLVTAVAILAVMTTWKLGRDRVAKFLRDRSSPLDQFLDEVDARDPVRVKGTAVFMTSTQNGTPPVLLHHFKHNQVLHEQVVLLSIVTEDVPFVARARRVEVEKLREGFFRVTAHYGFMQSAKVTDILRACDSGGLRTRPDSTSFYLGREKLVMTRNPGLPFWRKMLFAFLSRNARPATDFFKLPPDRVVEMGMALEL